MELNSSLSFLKVTKTCLSFQICDNPKACEIDPLKLKEADNVETHKVHYSYFCSLFSCETSISGFI